MSTCEKCWSLSYLFSEGDQPAMYAKLVKERNCTPEEQAGPDAAPCSACGRFTLHQHTDEPMCRCPNVLVHWISARRTADQTGEQQ